MFERLSCPKVRPVFAILIVGLGSACASESTTRSTDAPIVSNRSAMWEDGAKAVETGEAMITKGEKRLELGRQQVREGEAKIREESKRAEEAKLEYAQVASGDSATSDKREHASTLRAIGSRWEAAIQGIEGGNKLVAKGNASIARGESEIREGRLLMETGSVLMRNAHRSRLGLSSLPLPKR